MKTVYFISGLGADERVFQFLDLPGIEKRFIQWVTPEKGESLNAYCRRLIIQVKPQNEVILVGISFGGIVAQEIATIIPCQKVIIISSVKSPDEFNWSLSLVRKTKAHRIVPAWFLKATNHLSAAYYFSTKTKEESQLLHQIIRDTDQKFMVWAIDQIMEWRGNNTITVTHLHGTADRIFPIRSIRQATTISGGGHFMIVNRASEISKLLQETLTR
jgi:pimeloyl-ACP methyl ester carboxylesterase